MDGTRSKDGLRITFVRLVAKLLGIAVIPIRTERYQAAGSWILPPGYTLKWKSLNTVTVPASPASPAVREK